MFYFKNKIKKKEKMWLACTNMNMTPAHLNRPPPSRHYHHITNYTPSSPHHTGAEDGGQAPVDSSC